MRYACCLYVCDCPSIQLYRCPKSERSLMDKPFINAVVLVIVKLITSIDVMSLTIVMRLGD